ncbi:ATP-grasp fold amidoligase family protein [Aeromonas caviae]|uniref:ATP-grasp fold amidoligase family protein n=1 Tax=Aeromonas caviae TaxID=648 RepID=UPI0038D009A7
MREFMKSIINRLPFFIFVKIKSLFKLGYIINLKHPKTFNEKINHRKKNWNDPIYSICSDKLRAKEYVADKVGDRYVLRTLFNSDSIHYDDVTLLIEKYGKVVLKANHNSGQVFIIKEMPTPERIRSIVKSLNSQMSDDYGKVKHEPWYSSIAPRIFAEEVLIDEARNDILDYKFHVFTNKYSSSQDVVLQVDFDRHSNHTRTMYDENFNVLPFSWAKASIYSDLPKPKNFSEMVSVAKALGRDFAYVRVDLYSVNGQIYFGEMTFAHGSGFERFSSVFYDIWMGNKWVM